MNIGKTQADFRRSVTGYKKVPESDTLVLVGFKRDSKLMDSLISDLKFAYYLEVNKKKPLDSLLLVYLEKITYSYLHHPKGDKKISDSLLFYTNKKLDLSRKTKESDMTSRSYKEILSQYDKDSIYDQRRVSILMAWVNDYEKWVSALGVSFASDIPHLRLANYYIRLGDTEKGLNYAQRILNFSKANSLEKWWTQHWYGNYFYKNGLYAKAITHFDEIVSNPPANPSINVANAMVEVYLNMADIFFSNNEHDKVLNILPEIDLKKHCKDCNFSNQINDVNNRKLMVECDVYLKQKQPSKAFPILQKIVPWFEGIYINRKIYNYDYDRLWYDYYDQTNQPEKAFRHLKVYNEKLDSIRKIADLNRNNENKQVLNIIRGFEIRLINQKFEQEQIIQDEKILNLKKQSQIDALNAALQQEALMNESERIEMQRILETENLKTKAKQQKEKNEKQIKQFQINELKQKLILQNRTRRLWLGLVGLLLFLIISLFWSNRQLKKKNLTIKQLSDENLKIEKEKQILLIQQNENLEDQVKTRTIELENTLSNLRSTQAQLIQSEKMASLGELTAGIAHEIQNPLNFVNNFSEISVELIEELKESKQKASGNGNSIENEILGDLSQNLQKINHHGKRASDIVKGMLEHSRKSSVIKEETSINSLCEEYFRIAYHGYQASDKNFKADYETYFDLNLPKIKVISHDIGKVIINIINNAFYAVNERSKKGEKGYTPKISLLTKQENGVIVIEIQDNGIGIPDSIKDKIFQPFFTTKPTGQGTGLGLSLAYDIITKGHGGSLRMVSSESGSSFTIELPIA
jgi:signal transduction histidine kinase